MNVEFGPPKCTSRDLEGFRSAIASMTEAERDDPDLIDEERAKRIATGAGVAPHAVMNLVALRREVNAEMGGAP